MLSIISLNIKFKRQYRISYYLETNPEVYRNEPLIVEIIDNVQRFKDLDSAWKYFNEPVYQYPSFTKLSSTSYRYKDFFIDIGMVFVLFPYALFLSKSAEYNFSCLAEPAAIIKCGNYNNTVILITRIEGSEG